MTNTICENENSSYYINLSYCPKSKTIRIISPDKSQIIETDSEIMFNYVRGQIARWKYSGFSIEIDGKYYEISDNGDIVGAWPDELFNVNEDLLSYIMEHGTLRDEDDYSIYGIDNNLADELCDVDVIPEKIF